jgi:drug/metabolite transporter (DMT)-like permease
MVVLLVLLWGTSWPATKIALRNSEPVLLAGLRLALTALMLAPIAGMRREKPDLRSAIWVIPIAALLNVGSIVLSTVAVLYLTPGLAAILTYVQPPVTVVLEWVVLGKRPGIVRSVAVAIGFSGVAVLSLLGGSSVHLTSFGVVIALGGGVVWAGGTVFLKQYGSLVAPASLATGQFLIGAPIAVLWASSLPGGLQLHVSGAFLIALIYLAFTTAGGWLIWIHLLRQGRASTVATYVFLVPVVSVLASVIFLGEPFTPNLVVGGVLVIASLYLVGRSE